MAIAKIRRLQQTKEENHKLAQLVADLRLDTVMLQEVLATNVWSPCTNRPGVGGAAAASHRSAASVWAGHVESGPGTTATIGVMISS